MASQIRPVARRGPSGAWNRLKSATPDALQAYGLPSKGETRLNDFKPQEAFYSKIVERYMKFCAASGSDLEKQFAALSLNASKPLIPGFNGNAVTNDNNVLVPGSGQTAAKRATPGVVEPSPELQLILMAMRKLREAIVSTRRHDIFAQRCYIFIIRVAVLVSSWESYLPALTYLLHEIHPVTPLDPSELNEFVILHILDYACRLQDFHSAFLVKVGYGINDRKVQIVLKSLARDDWLSFWKVRNKVDGYQRAILGFAENDMRLRALKSLGRSYFTTEKAFVEKVTDKGWEELVKNGVGWELTDGEVVVIRR